MINNIHNKVLDDITYSLLNVNDVSYSIPHFMSVWFLIHGGIKVSKKLVNVSKRGRDGII